MVSVYFIVFIFSSLVLYINFFFQVFTRFSYPLDSSLHCLSLPTSIHIHHWSVNPEIACYMSRKCVRLKVLDMSQHIAVFDWLMANVTRHKWHYYLIPIKIRTPLNFAPLIFAALIFAHLRFRAHLIFAHPYLTVNLPFFHLFVAFFLSL